MWRDVLLILMAFLATLTYFRITPRRLAGYTRSAKTELAKRGRFQRVFLFISIALSLYLVSLLAYSFERFGLAGVLLAVALLTMFWGIVLTDVWQVSEKGERIINIATFSVIPPSYIAYIILTDMPLWQKIVYPVGGFCAAYGTRRLTSYIERKRKR